MENRGLEHLPNSHEKPAILGASVLNATRADCDNIETVFLALAELNSEHLETLATIAKQFSIREQNPKESESTVSQ
jgi:hypothetical protein